MLLIYAFQWCLSYVCNTISLPYESLSHWMVYAPAWFFRLFMTFICLIFSNWLLFFTWDIFIQSSAWQMVNGSYVFFSLLLFVEAAFCVRDNVVVSFHQCWNHNNHRLRMNFVACMQTQRQMKSKKFRNVIMLEKTSNCTLEFHSTMEFFEYVENRVRPPLCSLSISSRRIKLNLLNAAICHICSNW